MFKTNHLKDMDDDAAGDDGGDDGDDEGKQASKSEIEILYF